MGYRSNDMEKRFCMEVGGMKWTDFLEAKKYTACLSDKVMEWDDLACKESFYNAKNRFWSINGGPWFHAPLPCPDMYIDQVDWDAKVDPELVQGLETTREPVGEFEEERVVGNNIRLEDIKPTGWDVGDEGGWCNWNVLTGMIVGDGGEGSVGEGVKEMISSSNCQDCYKVMASNSKSWENKCSMGRGA